MHDASDAVGEFRDVEVDEEAERIARDSEIREELGGMDRCQCLDRLQLKDDRLLDDHINSPRTNLAAFVAYSDFMLSLERDATVMQFHAERFLIYRFHEARPEGAMHRSRRTNHRTR